MAHFEDLSPCRYFSSFPDMDVIAVGWLEPGHDYRRGPVSELFLGALTNLLNFPWAPFGAAGPHQCGLCVGDGPHGHQNLFVPSSAGVYVCPEMIAHYIRTHDYQPPEAFQEAVLACPHTSSDAYFDALEDCGLIAVWTATISGDLRSYHRASRLDYHRSLANPRPQSSGKREHDDLYGWFQQ